MLQILIGKNLPPLYEQNGELMIGDKKFMGVAQIELLPPKNERFPFVMARIKDGTNIASICRKCSEGMVISGKCNHKIHERAFFGTWTSSILNAAIKYGYRILQVLEMLFLFFAKNVISMNSTIQVNVKKLT